MEPENDIRIVSSGQPEKTSVQAAENQDWANLGYYKEQNELLDISSNIERKIVFIRRLADKSNFNFIFFCF